MDKPIFIFSSGMRSGSTLLQRLITASGQVLIWGEPGGAFNNLAEANLGYLQMLSPGSQKFKNGFGGNGEKQFLEFSNSTNGGVHSWIPCMNPPVNIINDGFKSFFTKVYHEFSELHGYSRWGVKEVRSGIDEAKFLKGLYPDAKFIFLVRNPFDCLSSLKRHNWMDRPDDKRALEYYAFFWLKLVSEFRKIKFGMLLRYEDLISEKKIITDLEQYLDIKLDHSFIKRSKVKGNVRNKSELNWYEYLRAKRIVKNELEYFNYN